MKFKHLLIEFSVIYFSILIAYVLYVFNFRTDLPLSFEYITPILMSFMAVRFCKANMRYFSKIEFLGLLIFYTLIFFIPLSYFTHLGFRSMPLFAYVIYLISCFMLSFLSLSIAMLISAYQKVIILKKKGDKDLWPAPANQIAQ